MLSGFPGYIWTSLPMFLSERQQVSRLNMRVSFWHTDLNIHLTNSRYLYLMDKGRLHLLAVSGLLSTCFKEKILPMTVGVDIQYRRELKLWQSFTLDTRITRVRDRVLEMEQTFLVGKRVHARALVKSLVLKDRKPVDASLFERLVVPPLQLEGWHVAEAPALPTSASE